jgi:hypothetical protein
MAQKVSARRTGIPPTTVSAVERHKIKSWDHYVERLTAAMSDQ